MNIREIEILLDKYYEGETTLQEELLLKNFFRTKDIPEHLIKHQEMFNYFEDSAKESLNNFTPSIALRPDRSHFYFITGIAACSLLLIGLYFSFRYDLSRSHQYNQTYQAKELAFNQAREALLMVSVGLNTGFDQVQKFAVFDKAMQNAQKLNKFYQCQSLIIKPDEQNR